MEALCEFALIEPTVKEKVIQSLLYLVSIKGERGTERQRERECERANLWLIPLNQRVLHATTSLSQQVEATELTELMNSRQGEEVAESQYHFNVWTLFQQDVYLLLMG